MLYLLIPLAAYLIGSFSTAVLVCRLMGLPDPRTDGSRNPGATHVLRLGRKTGAALALAGDAAGMAAGLPNGHERLLAPCGCAARQRRPATSSPPSSVGELRRKSSMRANRCFSSDFYRSAEAP